MSNNPIQLHFWKLSSCCFMRNPSEKEELMSATARKRQNRRRQRQRQENDEEQQNETQRRNVQQQQLNDETLQQTYSPHHRPCCVPVWTGRRSDAGRPAGPVRSGIVPLCQEQGAFPVVSQLSVTVPGFLSVDRRKSVVERAVSDEVLLGCCCGCCSYFLGFL